MPDQPITYRDAGVDIDAMNSAVLKMRQHVRGTYTPGVLTDVGSFGGMFSLEWTKYQDPILVSSIDGVGTKLKVAFAMKRHESVGVDLVSHCVNDILVQGARPLFFLDYFATGRLEGDVLVDVVKGLSDGCRAAGCALIGGETAEMPGMYPDNEYDLAGCIVGVVDRAKVVDGSKVQAGDAVIGIASNGLHTNGFSLARRVLFDAAGYDVFDTPASLGGQSVGDALLATHRCYAAPVLPLLDEFDIKAMAHITGGGFYDNIPRVLPSDCSVTLDRRAWNVPPIFSLIQEHGSVPDHDMYRTFNMGIGYVMVVRNEDVPAIVERLSAAGEKAGRIGEVHSGVHEVTVL